MLQFPRDHLDDLQVAQVVVNVVEQQFQEDIQWLVQRTMSPQRAQGLIVRTDKHQVMLTQQHAE